MNIKEFKEWLNQFPEDADVHTIIDHDVSCLFQGKEYVDYEFITYDENQFIKKTDSRYGKKILYIGIT